MKKLFTLLLCLSLIAGCFSGCAVKSSDPPSPGGTPDETGGESNISQTAPPSDEENSEPNVTNPPSTEPTGQDSTDPTDPEDRPMGGSSSDFCPIHHYTYHSYTISLVDYVGENNLEQWRSTLSSLPSPDGCLFPEETLPAFLEHFEISREELENLYYTTGIYYGDVWDFDLLYGGTPEEIDTFFRNIDGIQATITKRQEFSHLKFSLYVTHMTDWVSAFGEWEADSSFITLKTIVSELNIPRTELESMAQTNLQHYDYNFDLIYNPGSNVQINATQNQIQNDPHPTLAEDALICGITDYEIQ